MLDEQLTRINYAGYRRKAVDHAGPACVMNRDVRCFQLDCIAIPFVDQGIVIRGDDQRRRYAGEICGKNWRHLWVAPIYSLREVGVIPFRHLSFRQQVRAGSEHCP